jgi:hypothetical protein
MRTVFHFVALHSSHVILKDDQVATSMTLGLINRTSLPLIIQTLLDAEQCIYNWIPVDCQLLKDEEALTITEDSNPYSSDVSFIMDQSRSIYRVNEAITSRQCIPPFHLSF